MRKSIENLLSLRGAKSKTHNITFSSPADWIEALKGNDMKLPSSKEYIIHNDSWTGRSFDNYAEVYECLDKPWAKGMSQYRYMLESLKDLKLPAPKSIRRKRRYNEMDGELNTDRYLAGEAICFEDCFKTRVEGSPVITITVQINTNSHVDPDDLFWNSAATVALCDMLEAVGYAVEVIGYCSFQNIFHGHVPNFLASVVVKEAGKPVNAESMIAALSCFAFRVLMLLTVHLIGRDDSGHYGSQVILADEALREACVINGELFNVPNLASRSAAVAMMEMVLSKIVDNQVQH